MGDIRAGSVASILGPVTTVVIGGLAAFSVAIGGWYIFPKLRQLDRLADLCPNFMDGHTKPTNMEYKNEQQ